MLRDFVSSQGQTGFVSVDGSLGLFIYEMCYFTWPRNINSFHRHSSKQQLKEIKV